MSIVDPSTHSCPDACTDRTAAVRPFMLVLDAVIEPLSHRSIDDRRWKGTSPIIIIPSTYMHTHTKTGPSRPASPPPSASGKEARQTAMNIQIPGFSSSDQARGLQNFITDIRNCTSREAEQQRIDKELANIRSKFASSSSLTPYQVRSGRQAGRCTLLPISLWSWLVAWYFIGWNLPHFARSMTFNI